jgi:restriction endonuclease S subunit
MITQKIYTNDLEGRVDPHYYKPEFLRLISQLDKGGQLKPLSELTEKISSGATPKSGGNDYTNKDSGIPFIRSGDISEDEKINYDKILYIKESVHNKKLQSSKLQKDDVLIAIVGATIGQVSVYRDNNEANINQAIALVRCKPEVNPRYVKAFLLSGAGQKQLERIKRPVARANINLEEVGSIKIPLASLQTQNEIADIIQNAYLAREEKLKQADELLNSIDGYVRQQLGIDYTEPEEEKIYIVNSQDLEDNRQDPHYHNPKFATTIKQLKKGKYPIEALGKYITEIRYGASVKNDYVDKGIPLLRILNIKPNNIDLTELVHLPKSKSKEIGNCYVYKDDLLVSRSGTIGIVAVVPQEADGFAYGSFMIKFRLNDELDGKYVSVWLNSDISKLLIQRERIGAIQGNITIPTIQGFLLPVSSLDKQKAIADSVMEKYQKVEDLKNEASRLLEEAKKKVEAMILN